MTPEERAAEIEANRRDFAQRESGTGNVPWTR
jgi:hypothetical protein